jgi:3-oxoacyl-[acyl-carrier-protein] synthase II
MPESVAVAIAGCGAVTAAGYGLEPLRSAVRANASGLRAAERFTGPFYQSRMVGAVPSNGINPEEDDPAWHLATQALQQAREQTKDTLQTIDPKRIGLVLSTTKANIAALEGISEGQLCSERARRHLQGDLLAADLALAHGALGPVQCVSVACVSGLVAIQQGGKLIQRDEADAVLVLGVDHLSAFVMAGFSALKALDPQGCRPFDRNRCGLSPGEAGAAIVLVRAPLLAEQSASDYVRSPIFIRGWGASNDANHMTGPARDGSGLASAIGLALASAALGARDIHYVNAHGTGTPYNDAMESEALRRVFGTSCPPVSGSKGMLGHTLGAAGVIETIVCVLALEERLMPGTPRLSVAAEGAPASLLHAPRLVSCLDNVLKLSTGFGGVNGALVLSLAQS